MIVLWCSHARQALAHPQEPGKERLPFLARPPGRWRNSEAQRYPRCGKFLDIQRFRKIFNNTEVHRLQIFSTEHCVTTITGLQDWYDAGRPEVHSVHVGSLISEMTDP
jgi:hypothetical protein